MKIIKKILSFIFRQDEIKKPICEICKDTKEIEVLVMGTDSEFVQCYNCLNKNYSSEKEYHKNGQLAYDWQTLNGLLHGSAKSWHKNGNKQFLGKHFHGHIFGITQGWYPNASRNYIEQYKINSLMHGVNIKFNYENNKK